jgi:FMN phosphatase YigB (HAD superfamily)
MTKKAIVVDLDGALLKSRPFDMAHKEWFRIMAELLHDQTINEHAFKEDYYPHVHEVMKRYLGDISEESRNVFARNIYSMVIVESLKKWDVVDEFVEYLREIKKKYHLILITTAPSISIEPILEKIHCKDLFDIIVKSPMEKQPSKKTLFEEFIKKHGKPEFYIGRGDKDLNSIKELGIRTISVNWVSSGDVKGNFDVNKVSEIDPILERFRIE